jgi:hypothetical protein
MMLRSPSTLGSKIAKVLEATDMTGWLDAVSPPNDRYKLAYSSLQVFPAHCRP